METITKEFVLKIKFTDDVNIYEDEKGILVSNSIRINYGPDDEIGIPKNICVALGWKEDEILIGYVNDGKLFLKKETL